MAGKSGEGGAPALKGLRLCTMDRAEDGYGFHMYTNKQLRGQYIKWVSPNSPADLAGVLAGDHVIQVDGIDVLDMAHHKVVEIIRSGDGNGRKVLVIDKETEKEMNSKGEKLDPESAIVMIPRAPTSPTGSGGPQDVRTPSPPDEDEVDSGPVSPASPSSPSSYSPTGEQERSEAAMLNLSDMAAALPKRNKRAQVKNRDWKSSVQAYNAL